MHLRQPLCLCDAYYRVANAHEHLQHTQACIPLYESCLREALALTQSEVYVNIACFRLSRLKAQGVYTDPLGLLQAALPMCTIDVSALLASSSSSSSSSSASSSSASSSSMSSSTASSSQAVLAGFFHTAHELEDTILHPASMFMFAEFPNYMFFALLSHADLNIVHEMSESQGVCLLSAVSTVCELQFFHAALTTPTSG